MKKLYSLCLVILSLNCYSQIEFEKGYFIDDTNQKTECLIKNVDWKNNPSDFEYKLTESAKKQYGSITTIKEFGIYNVTKYIRRSVNIDMSKQDLSRMSNVRAPIFEEKKMFLKVLVEGKASLYIYENGPLRRFFYSNEDSDVEQLIFKQYYNKDGNILTNDRFKQQLYTNLECSSFSMKKFERLDYSQKELIGFFTDYNECKNSEFKNFEKNRKRGFADITIRPGVRSSSISVDRDFLSTNTYDFDNELSFRFGIEFEFNVGFNGNKWALIVEPTYQSYKSELESDSGEASVEYKSIEIPLGIRHYFHLSKNSKIFVNGQYVLDIVDQESRFNSNFELGVDSKNNLAFGLGYKYNNKFSLEIRYHTTRKLMMFNNASDLESTYNDNIELIFGYTIF